MTTLSEHVRLACPQRLAQVYLDSRLLPVASAEREVPMSLTAPIPGLHLEPATDVLLSVECDASARDGQVWKLKWRVPGSKSFPEFSGVLAVRPGDSRSASSLTLTGAYTPPFGALGTAFDMAVGSRIASATARTLLQTFGADIERLYAERAQTLEAHRAGR